MWPWDLTSQWWQSRVAVAAFVSFLLRVQLSDTGLSVSAAHGKEDCRLFIIL